MTDPYASDVRVTGRRLILTPPCGHTIGVPSAGIDLDQPVGHEVACRVCGRRWTVAFLADRRWGLRAAWTERP